MRRSWAKTGNLPLPAAQVDRVSALVRLSGWLSSLWDKRRRAQDRIAARYDGCAWCDSTERQLANDVLTGTHTRL